MGVYDKKKEFMRKNKSDDRIKATKREMDVKKINGIVSR